MVTQRFRKNCVAARAAVGLPWLTSYTFHYFISHAVMSGVDMFTIAKWVGHSSLKMIEDTYGHLSPEYRARQMLKVSVGKSIIPSVKQEVSCADSARQCHGDPPRDDDADFERLRKSLQDN